MTAHVAEAEEARGRVILRFSAWQPSDVAIHTALLVATAFQSEVEVLFVEDIERVNFAGFPFARELSPRGGPLRAVSPRAIRAEFRRSFAEARKRITALAAGRGVEVRVYESFVRDNPVHALVAACARSGPWNVIALAEAFGSPAPCSLDELFDEVADATGIIVAGPAARIRRGPVVVALEDTAELHGMLRTGRRIAAALEDGIILLLVAADAAEIAQMEIEVRLALADAPGIAIARAQATYGDRAVVAEAIRRLGSGFVIARFGGVTVPRRQSLGPLLSALDCPLLLVK